jgi:hypothetical protein
MPRSTLDPIVDDERLPDIGFLTKHLVPRDNHLLSALNRLRKRVPNQIWEKTFIYEGALPDTSLGTVENIMTHQFLVDIPTDMRIELTSFTLGIKIAPTSKLTLQFKKRPLRYVNNVVADGPWESILDEQGIFLAPNTRSGTRDTFVVPYLNNGDEIQVDCVEFANASNPQVMMRGRFRWL